MSIAAFVESLRGHGRGNIPIDSIESPVGGAALALIAEAVQDIGCKVFCSAS
jgi:hypothetical protein